MHIWGQLSQPLVGEGVEAEVLPNNPEAAPRGGVRHTRGGARTGSTFTHQLFVRLNAVTPDLDFTHRITPEYSVLIGIKQHPRESSIHRWEYVEGEKSFHHGSARMELSACGLNGLWIFCVFLRGTVSRGRGGLQREGKPKLLHGPEQRLFRVHEEENGVLLRYLLSENRRLLRGLPTRVPSLR